MQNLLRELAKIYLINNQILTNKDFGTRQAVALNSFLEGGILLGFLIKNLTKSLPLKEYIGHTCCRVP